MLLRLFLELPTGQIVERMFSAYAEDTLAYFIRSGARRCYNGEAISFSVKSDNMKGAVKNLHIGDWRDDARNLEANGIAS